MQLTKNFTLQELICSQYGARRGIPNFPNQEQMKNLKILCLKILQPIRDNFDRPVIVSSGFRSPLINSGIGGSPKSQHLEGRAVDFTVVGFSNYEVLQWVKNNLDFDQLIDEYNSWIHCSYNEGKNRSQVLKIG